MNKAFRGRVSALVFLLSGLLGSQQVLAAGDYQLATASTGGTYYPVGVALSTLVKVKLQSSHQIKMSAISSAGSAENVQLIGTSRSPSSVGTAA